MKSSIEQDSIANKARQTLDESIETIDTDVARRLQQARIEALNTIEEAPTWWQPPAVFASLLAAVFAVGMVTTISLNDYSSESMPVAEIEDSDELYRDLDFYVWLANEESAS